MRGCLFWPDWNGLRFRDDSGLLFEPFKLIEVKEDPFGVDFARVLVVNDHQGFFDFWDIPHVGMKLGRILGLPRFVAEFLAESELLGIRALDFKQRCHAVPVSTGRAPFDDAVNVADPLAFADLTLLVADGEACFAQKVNHFVFDYVTQAKNLQHGSAEALAVIQWKTLHRRPAITVTATGSAHAVNLGWLALGFFALGAFILQE